mmetsp:Transcript_71501/g.197448  ORF Transcript_71501/g.197448 Transcript_71501/m.197448 type:complete len:143 (+) Transcript_71501:312-740(+)
MLLQFPQRAVSMDERPPPPDFTLVDASWDFALEDIPLWDCTLADESPGAWDFTLADPSPGNFMLADATPPWDDMPKDKSPKDLFSCDLILKVGITDELSPRVLMLKAGMKDEESPWDLTLGAGLWKPTELSPSDRSPTCSWS